MEDNPSSYPYISSIVEPTSMTLESATIAAETVAWSVDALHKDVVSVQSWQTISFSTIWNQDERHTHLRYSSFYCRKGSTGINPVTPCTRTFDLKQTQANLFP